MIPDWPEVKITDLTKITKEKEDPEKKIRIGILEDLEYKNSEPYKSAAAVINALHGKGVEVDRDGKPCLEMALYDDMHISEYAFDLGVKFIDKYVDKGKVLVCCEMGTSRSVAVGIAYYMSKGKTFDESKKLLDRGTPGTSIIFPSLVDIII